MVVKKILVKKVPGGKWMWIAYGYKDVVLAASQPMKEQGEAFRAAQEKYGRFDWSTGEMFVPSTDVIKIKIG